MEEIITVRQVVQHMLRQKAVEERQKRDALRFGTPETEAQLEQALADSIEAARLTGTRVVQCLDPRPSVYPAARNTLFRTITFNVEQDPLRAEDVSKECRSEDRRNDKDIAREGYNTGFHPLKAPGMTTIRDMILHRNHEAEREIASRNPPAWGREIDNRKIESNSTRSTLKAVVKCEKPAYRRNIAYAPVYDCNGLEEMLIQRFGNAREKKSVHGQPSLVDGSVSRRESEELGSTSNVRNVAEDCFEILYRGQKKQIPVEICCHLCGWKMRLFVRKAMCKNGIRQYPSYRCLRKGCQTYRSVSTYIIMHSQPLLPVHGLRYCQNGVDDGSYQLMKQPEEEMRENEQKVKIEELDYYGPSESIAESFKDYEAYLTEPDRLDALLNSNASEDNGDSLFVKEEPIDDYDDNNDTINNNNHRAD